LITTRRLRRVLRNTSAGAGRSDYPECGPTIAGNLTAVGFTQRQIPAITGDAAARQV
jgi:hypothetical protein